MRAGEHPRSLLPTDSTFLFEISPRPWIDFEECNPPEIRRERNQIKSNQIKKGEIIFFPAGDINFASLPQSSTRSQKGQSQASVFLFLATKAEFSP